jgi:hypothetical protein
MSLVLSLVAAACAAMVAWVFVRAWRDQDVVLAVVLGVALLSLLIVAILAVRVSL